MEFGNNILHRYSALTKDDYSANEVNNPLSRKMRKQNFIIAFTNSKKCDIIHYILTLSAVLRERMRNTIIL